MFRYRPLTLALLAALACSQAQAQSEDARTLLIQQGYFWQGQDKPERAAEVWSKVLLIDAQQPDALYGLGLIAVKAERMPEAKGYLQRLQAQSPLPRLALLLEQDIRLTDPANIKLLEDARLLVEEGDRARAAQVYRQALGGKPGQGQVGVEVYNNLAYVAPSWSEARSGLERLQREYPDDPYVALFLAKHMARYEDSRADGIRALARLALREDIGGDADESWRLALTWIGPPNQAQQPLFEQFLRNHPDDDEIRALLTQGRSQAASGGAAGWARAPALERGFKALEKGEFETAEREFTGHLQRNPNDADALGGLGIVRQRQERLEDAKVLFTKASQQPGGRSWRAALDDVRYWALLQRARESVARERITDARQQLIEAQRLKPRENEALLMLADLQVQQGEMAQAEKGYRQVLAQKPREARALRGLAQVLAQQDKPDEALRLLDTLPPDEREKWGGLGQLRAEQSMMRARAAEARGDVQGMREALESALRDDPNNPWVRLSLARLYVDLGAVDEARSLVDGLLVNKPDDPDTLYTSALLSVQLGEWAKAQATLARISREARNADVNRLVSEVDFNLQLERIAELSRTGQRAEARVFLERIESSAEKRPARLAALASAYASAGAPQRAMDIMRDLLARSPRRDVALTLSYAGVLLQAEQDVEVAGILRDLQGTRMTLDERKRYDDLLFHYRVRQAEQLRERGELAAAYDTLAPALAQRPQDPLAVAALARMYSANGDATQALSLFKPLVQRNPNDASLQVGAADMAAQARENAYAEAALEKAVKLAPQDAEILTTAARVYRTLGRSGTAAKLLSRVVAQEKRQQTPAFATAEPSGTRAANPFSGIGSLAAAPATIPAPVQGMAELPLGNGIPVPGSGRAEALPLRSEYLRLSSLDAEHAAAPSAGNPFAISDSRKPHDPRAGMSVAARALDEIREERSPYVVQGLTVRSNDSESGLSKLTDVQAPLEINFPAGDSRVALRVTPVSLNAGSVDENAKTRFGSGALGASSEIADIASTRSALQAVDVSALTPVELTAHEQSLAALDSRIGNALSGVTGAVGRQRDNGVGLAAAWESEANGLKADIGVSPMGFLYSTVIGGVSLDRPISGTDHVRYGVTLSRRMVTDSLTSFAGARDARSGLEWGGVTANGGRAQISYDDGDVGAYGYGALHALRGHNVKSNTRAELGGGVYWYLVNDEDSMLTAGLSLTGIGYDNNQGHFTYGSGGYFSPQGFYSLGVPVNWSHRGERWSYALRGSLGVQHIKQDSADYHPNDSDMQAALEQTSGVAAGLGIGIPTRVSGSSDTGIGYSLAGNAEYRLGSHFFLGGQLGVDNAQDYRQWSGGLYLRYMFENMTGPMALPVSPYQSPYAN